MQSKSKSERAIQWLKYFMTLAKNVSEMSKDPSHKVGAVIVDKNKRIVSTGFNGFAKNIIDSDDRLDNKDIKRKLTLHAEENAVTFAKRDLEGCDIYVYGYPPCTHCTSLLIQSGIKCIYYCNPSHRISEHWKAGVDFLSDIIKNSTFPEEEIERERNVILQEIAMYEDNISSVSWNEIISNAFKGQALGRKVIGTEENVKRFTRNDLIKYMTDGYVANKMTFSICGNVKHEEVVKYVKAAFSNLNTEFKLQEFSSKYKSPKKRKEVETKFDQAHVCLTVPGRKMFERSNYVHSIFNNILDGGMSTRLFQEVRERNGLGYATSTIAESEPNTGIYGVWAAVDKEDIEKTVEVLEATFKSMMQNIGDDEFEKAKNITLYNLTSKEDDCYSVMDANAVCGIFDKKRKSLKTKKAIINKITKQDVIEYAKSLCDKEMDIVIVKPKVEERI